MGSSYRQLGLGQDANHCSLKDPGKKEKKGKKEKASHIWWRKGNSLEGEGSMAEWLGRRT